MQWQKHMPQSLEMWFILPGMVWHLSFRSYRSGFWTWAPIGRGLFLSPMTRWEWTCRRNQERAGTCSASLSQSFHFIGCNEGEKKSTLFLAGLESGSSTCCVKYISPSGIQQICVSLISHLAMNEIRAYVLWSVEIERRYLGFFKVKFPWEEPG